MTISSWSFDALSEPTDATLAGIRSMISAFVAHTGLHSLSAVTRENYDTVDVRQLFQATNDDYDVQAVNSSEQHGNKWRLRQHGQAHEFDVCCSCNSISISKVNS